MRLSTIDTSPAAHRNCEENQMTPHIHQKEIIAWANGEQIEYWDDNSNEWTDVNGKYIVWLLDGKYRVKLDTANELRKFFYYDCEMLLNHKEACDLAQNLIRKFNITLKDES